MRPNLRAKVSENQLFPESTMAIIAIIIKWLFSGPAWERAVVGAGPGNCAQYQCVWINSPIGVFSPLGQPMTPCGYASGRHAL